MAFAFHMAPLTAERLSQHSEKEWIIQLKNLFLISTVDMSFFRKKFKIVLSYGLIIMHPVWRGIRLLFCQGSVISSVYYRVSSQKKVSIKTFIQGCSRPQYKFFEFIWIQYICKFCLVYHLKDLDASR